MTRYERRRTHAKTSDVLLSVQGLTKQFPRARRRGAGR